MAVEVAQVVDVNLWAVLVAAAAAMAIGAVWYSPVMFGKSWQRMVTAWTGLKEKDMRANAGSAMVGSMLLNLVTAYVLAYMVGLVNANTFVEGLSLGGWVGLGFVATSSLMHALYHGERKKLFAVNFGYSFLSLLVMGAILAVWR